VIDIATVCNIFLPSTPQTNPTFLRKEKKEEKMAKSIRSKSKKKFREIKRQKLDKWFLKKAERLAANEAHDQGTIKAFHDGIAIAIDSFYEFAFTHFLFIIYFDRREQG